MKRFFNAAYASASTRLDFGVKAVAVQKPNRILNDAAVNPILPDQLEILENRRAGIEPSIGHLKNIGRWGGVTIHKICG